MAEGPACLLKLGRRTVVRGVWRQERTGSESCSSHSLTECYLDPLLPPHLVSCPAPLCTVVGEINGC